VSSTRTSLLAAVVLLVTFGAGMAAGMFAVHLFHMRGMPGLDDIRAGLLVERLDRRLDLTDAQRKQIEEIIARRHQRIMSITADVRPAIHKEIFAANAEIEKVLTPEQLKKWERIKMRLMPGRHGPGMRIHKD
jgi:Spy/CpxP family protein refolding chaperone